MTKITIPEGRCFRAEHGTRSVEFEKVSSDINIYAEEEDDYEGGGRVDINLSFEQARELVEFLHPILYGRDD